MDKCVSCIKDQVTGDCYTIKDATARADLEKLQGDFSSVSGAIGMLSDENMLLEKRVKALENAPSGDVKYYSHAISFGAESTAPATRYKVKMNVTSSRDTAYTDDGHGSFIDDIIHMLPLPVTLSGLLSESMSGFGVMYNTGDIICIKPTDGTFVNFTPKTSSAGIWSFKDTVVEK